MKKFIFILVVLIFMGAGCNNKSINEGLNDDTAENKFEELEKKQLCASYKEKIKKEIIEDFNEDNSLEKIFFSKKENSCLYITYQMTINAKQEIYWSFFLVDYLSGEILEAEFYNGAYDQVSQTFNEVISKYE